MPRSASGMTVRRPDKRFRVAVVAAATAVGALTVAGGAVRVTESGVGCPDWPLCDGRVVPHAELAPIVEYAHRAVAAVTIVLLALVTVWALRRYRARRDIAVPVTAAAALVPTQALLGAVVVWLELPDRIVAVHFMVGMVMLGLMTYASVATWRGHTSVSNPFRVVALVTGAVGLLLVSLGAAVVATDALHACGEEWPGCNGGVARGGGTAVLQSVHRLTGYAVTALAVALLVVAGRGRPALRAAVAPVAAAAAQVAIGVAMVLSAHDTALHDALRIGHVAGAAALWASVVACVAVVTTQAGHAPTALSTLRDRVSGAAHREGSVGASGRRFAVLATCALVVAVALPVALGYALVPVRGGAGVVTGTIWVANEESDSITGIDAGTHAVVTVVRGVPGPHNVQAGHGGASVWVTGTPRDLVAAIDADTLALRGFVATGKAPAHVDLTPDSRTALVTNTMGNGVAFVDATGMRLRGVVQTGPHPHGLRSSPDGRHALIANHGGSTVTLVDLRRGVAWAAIPVGGGPVQVAWAPDGRHAFVTVTEGNAVVKVDVRRRRVVGRATVARGPIQLAVTPDGETVVVASQGSAARPEDEVSFISTRTMRVVGVLTTGAGAHGVAIEPGGRQAFVTDVWAGDVAVIDLAARRVVDRIEVGGAPNGISFSPRVQAHARAAANMGSARIVDLPLGGRTDGGATHGHHD